MIVGCTLTGLFYTALIPAVISFFAGGWLGSAITKKFVRKEVK